MRQSPPLTLVLALAILAVCIGLALSQTEWSDPGGSRAPPAAKLNQPAAAPATGRKAPDTDEAANARRDQIRAEIAALGDHPWAGEYSLGDGLGVSEVLLLAPKAGYVFEWHGCLGLYDRNYGPVAEKDGKLILTFTFENTRGPGRGVAPEFIPVRWGQRRYLIPADDVVGFCNRVNQGLGSYGGDFLRRVDRDKPMVGLPDLPPGFQGYLLPEPVDATVTAVGAPTTKPGCGDQKVTVTSLTLDAGKNRGLKVGMELFVRDPDGGPADKATITEVGDDRSEVVVEEAGEGATGPWPGWRASTRAFWLPRDK